MVNLIMSFINGKTGSIDEMDIIQCLSRAYYRWNYCRNGHMPVEFLEQNLTEQVEHSYKWCIALKVMMDSTFKYMVQTKRDIAKYVPTIPVPGPILDHILAQWTDTALENIGCLR